MIAIIRANEVQLVADGKGGWDSVPDLKLPDASSASFNDHGLAMITVRGKTMLLHGPYSRGADKYYLMDAPLPVLKRVRTALGNANVRRFVAFLRANKANRVWAKGLGLKPIRNSAGGIVGLLPPVAICGVNPVDLEDDDLEDAEELADL